MGGAGSEGGREEGELHDSVLHLHRYRQDAEEERKRQECSQLADCHVGDL